MNKGDKKMKILNMVKTFEVGKTYQGRSVCDHDCIFSITVVRRTAKMLHTSNGKTLKIAIHDFVESVKPMGNYSMAPIIRAA